MQARIRWWLLGVLVLVVASLLGVFEPIKFRDRKDPDTGRPIAPVKRIGKIRLYKPYPGITLGLDLRGGVHLVLEAQSEGVFRYTASGLKQSLSDDEANELHGKIADAIPADQIGTQKRGVELSLKDGQVTIRTRAKTRGDVSRQDALIKEGLAKVLPDVAPVGNPELLRINKKNLDSVKTILMNRVDRLGVAEPIIQTLPDQQRILVELPGVKDPVEAQRLIKTTAELEFRWIPRRYAYGQGHGPESPESTNGRGYIFTDESGNEVEAQKVLDESQVVVTGRDLKPNSEVLAAVGQQVQVSFELQGEARKTLETFTRGHVGYYLAVVLDGKLIMCPIIKDKLPGQGVIEGGFDGADGMKKAQELAVLLNAGALPYDLEYVENRTVSPEYGKGALEASLYAGMVGLGLVLVFMVFYYRLPGLLADLALIIYIILLLGGIRLVNQVLTLPGILAVIITIGMAVDANIIIFERLKEEIRTGKTLRSAVEAAFKRAWTAILDSNVCTIGTGVVLFIFGTGPIKGFAVALIIGVLVSLFTAVSVTRLFMSMTVESSFARNTALFGVSPGEMKGQ